MNIPEEIKPNCSSCEFFGNQDEYFGTLIFGDEVLAKSLIIVLTHPTEQEVKDGEPFSGKENKFLIDTIKDIEENFTLLYAVRCQTSKLSNVTKNIYDSCEVNLKNTIKELNPERVVLLSKMTYLSMFPEDVVSGKSVSKIAKLPMLEIDKVKYGVNYHPNYIVKNGGVKAPQYGDYVERFKYLFGVSTPGSELGSSLKINYREMSIGTITEMTEFFKDESLLGLDYEANHADPWHEDFVVKGFSISSKDSAYYMAVEGEVDKESKDILISFLKRKIPWSYNAKFEINVTWSWLGELILLNDVYALCKMDCSPAGLKENSRVYLKVNIWEEEVHTYTTCIGKMFRFIEKLPITSDKRDMVLSGGLDNYVEYVKTTDDKLLINFKRLAAQIEECYELIGRADTYAAMKWFPHQWGAVPNTVLSSYCCYDSFYTIMLHQELYSKYKKAYIYYISQTWLATMMEAFGTHWKDDIAEEQDIFYTREALSSLKSLISLCNLPQESKIEASTCTTIDDLKKIFNPMSNKYEAQLPFWEAFKTDEMSAAAILYFLETEILLSVNINNDYVSIIGNNKDLDVTEILLKLQTVVESDKNPKGIRELKRIYSKLETDVLHGQFSRFASEVIEFLYEAITRYGGVDVDNKDTWNSQFWMLYYLRTYKKLMKSKSTYIKGTVGRNAVYLSKVKSGMIPPIRIKKWDEVPRDYELKPDERWILNSEFRENSADCLTYETKILLTNGKTIKIGDLYEEGLTNENKKVFSYDHEIEEIIETEITDVILSSEVFNICTVTFYSGYTVRCTPNHRFLLENGEYCQARNLSGEIVKGIDIDLFVSHVEIKKLKRPEKVFDLTINLKTPCFSLENGIISHNTKR